MDRSENMRRIQSRNTKPEIILRHALHNAGFRYGLNNKTVPGHPDLWLKKWNTAVFVNGCFWHRHSGCKYAYFPNSNVEFWTTKFESNIKRDETVRRQLLEKGIRQLIVWECSLKNSPDIAEKVREFLMSEEQFMEI